MAAQDTMSPIHCKAQKLPPLTPGSVPIVGTFSIQPSPNRTEAAAAMMHLLTGNTNQENKMCAAFKPKAKSRYVRRAPKKVGTSAKRQIKTAWMDADTAGMGHIPVKIDADQGSKMLKEGERSAKNEDLRMDGNKVTFFPFREYNRKEKSLGLLCENFLKLHCDNKISEICLDRAATELGVERRRIYDIVNILESIHLVSRKSKNLYNWHGLVALPTSVNEMKQRYAEVQQSLPTGSSKTECPPFRSDRRRGKSLSKLSQMFVQLFLEKEDCIIPLDQAAKQLIQMEDSENVEDRLLKTKIRRLYDVANVLVSVGLIEKLQLSSSRKPLFRWKTRSTASIPTTPKASACNVNGDETKPSQPLTDAADYVKTEVMSSCVEGDNTDAMKSPETCNSDMSDDSSDSQSDASSCGSKRKQNDQGRSDVKTMPDSESLTKRNRPSEGQEDMDIVSIPTIGEKSLGLLRMDANDEPIHPQTIFREQQEQVKLYMQQYIHEYVNFLAEHERLPIFNDGAERRDNLTTASAFKTEAIAAISKDIHGTPVSLPSLAGSIQDLLLSESSPQSVAEFLAAQPSTTPDPPITTVSGTRK
ncbi:unnamed protein product [Peronospora farinosa]|uniref:E2F/DP family winged-helix DNA-binding domain-containing protein n=1 Tax=Peronospora farinosa TaxID=134698 RepID=A0AAV0UWK1_9STRA|nr:unnamed protein product [Peronospora farinosa]